MNGFKKAFVISAAAAVFTASGAFADFTGPRTITQINPQTTVNIPSVTITQINPTMINPNFNVNIPQIGNFTSVNIQSVNISNIPIMTINPTIVGIDTNMTSLFGMRFDDIYIADPENSPGTKSIAEMTRRDFARFGIDKPAQSALEAKEFPNANIPMTAVEQNAPLPLDTFCIDDVGAEG